MIVKAFQTYLESKTAVTNLVGTRIYPRHLPRDNTTYPVLTHQLISNNHLHVIGSAAGQSTARVQVDCWGLKLADVETLAEAVRGILQGYSGKMGTVDVGFVMLVNDMDMHESPKDASEQWLYRRVMDFTVKYGESVPTF